MYDFNRFSMNLQKAIKLALDAAKYYGEFMDKLPEDIRNRVSDGGSV